MTLIARLRIWWRHVPWEPTEERALGADRAIERIGEGSTVESARAGAPGELHVTRFIRGDVRIVCVSSGEAFLFGAATDLDMMLERIGERTAAARLLLTPPPPSTDTFTVRRLDNAWLFTRGSSSRAFPFERRAGEADEVAAARGLAALFMFAGEGLPIVVAPYDAADPVLITCNAEGRTIAEGAAAALGILVDVGFDRGALLTRLERRKDDGAVESFMDGAAELARSLEAALEVSKP